MLFHQLPVRGEITTACPLDQFALGVQWTAHHRLARLDYTADGGSVPRNPGPAAGVRVSMAKLRILPVALLVFGYALAPGAAHAKGAGAAEVTGPGLDEPIQIDNHNAEYRLSEAAGLLTVMWPEEAAVVESRRPRGALGPRYVVTYDWMVGQDADLGYLYEPVRQRIYPFAPDGPVTYVPPGQRLRGEPVGSGWYRAGPELRDLLVAAGVPEPRRS